MKTRQERHKERVQARIQKREHRENTERQHFTAPVTGKQARHISGAEANMTYGDTQRQNAAQIRASKQQQQNVGGWYDHFANEIAASRGEVAGAYGAANQAIAGNIQTAAADNTARNADLASQDAKFAQLTGAPQNTAGPATDAAAQGQRDLYGAAIAAPVAAQGANAFAYLTDQKTNAKGEGIYQKVQERKRRQSLQQDRKALLKEKGQYRTSKLDELRSREQARADEKWKVNKAFPLEKASAAADAAAAAADNGFRNRELGIREKELKGGGGSGGGRTPKEKQDAREGRRGAVAAGSNLIKANGVPKSPKEWAGLQALLEDKDEISPTEAAFAIKRLKQRYANKGKSEPTLGEAVSGISPIH